MSGRRASIAHVPALDGLRGTAVLGVMAFHAGELLKGGYLGVDLFFVLSGFLITSILLAEVEATSKVDLTKFWIRRARRLFPALLSLMPAVALYCWLLDNYAEKGWRILDTHMGSGSLAIACYKLGHPLTACEIDQEYYDKAIERIRGEQSQTRLFS